MTCDRLVCANCAGPVNEARCSVCRAQRARQHRDGLSAAVTPAMLLALLVALLSVALAAREMAL
ncbi:hypothetical protein [Streptomyces chumphonensis]|uniref:hypothetical protein n=1 Tax=Streptomyces chumphonensis TaxID=1214925 RepID=UPI003D70EB94